MLWAQCASVAVLMNVLLSPAVCQSLWRFGCSNTFLDASDQHRHLSMLGPIQHNEFLLSHCVSLCLFFCLCVSLSLFLTHTHTSAYTLKSYHPQC